ncbi:MAG: PTS IIA-like nitrogen regulatory protein PtsN [Pseudomonadota bacterium]
MQISEILTQDCVLVKVECRSKKDALDTLAKIIANSDNSTSQTEVYDCLLARERLGSTGLGNGIAIPHGRLPQSKKTIGAFIQLPEAIDYDANDKLPVDLLFALIVPEESTDEHLQILSKLAEKFSDHNILQQLRKETDSEKLYSILSS